MSPRSDDIAKNHEIVNRLYSANANQDQSIFKPRDMVREGRNVASAVLKLSIAYLMIGGVLTFYGAFYYGVTVAPLVVGLVSWILPFLLVYSIRGKRRSTVFKFTFVIFVIVGLAFLASAILNYETLENCLRSFCSIFGTDYLNVASVDLLAAAFIWIGLLYIRYSGNSSKCPSCKSPWAKSLDTSSTVNEEFTCRFCGQKWIGKTHTAA